MNNREVMQQALDYIVTTNKSSQFWLVPNSNLNKTVAALRAALAEPQDEPVAWMYEHDGMVHDAACPPFFAMNRWKTPVGEPYTETPLYTNPAPVRQPLTEEEIKRCGRYMSVFGATPFEQLVYFARAIEQRHGIGVQDE